MKRARKFVTVKLYPSGGNYQIAYSGAIPLSRPNHYPPPMEGWGTCFGPFLINIDSGTCVPYLERKIYCDSLVQGPALIGREKGVDHNFAQGVLRDHDGTYTTGFEQLCRSDMLPDDSFSFSSARLLSLDDLGAHSDRLKIYDRGGYTPKYSYKTPPFFLWGCDYRYFVGNNLCGVSAEGGKRRLDSWSDPESGFTWIHSMDITNERLEGDYYIVSLHHQYYQTDQEIQEWDDEYSLDLVFVSPTVNIALDDGTRVRTRVDDAKSLIINDLRHLSRLTPADGAFYSAQNAIEAMRLCNINGLAFVKDLLAIKELVEPILKLIKNPLSFKQWASLMLWYHYGVRLTWKDWMTLLGTAKSIKKAARTLRLYARFRNSLQTRYGSFTEPIEYFGSTGIHRSTSRVVARWKYPTKETSWGAFSAIIEDMDFRITAENLWDLIPFSFVVDWFTGIGDLFEQLDTTVELDRLDVRDWVYSTHNSITTSDTQYLDSLHLQGAILLDTYSRTASQNLPSPPWERGALSFLHHWWEGALIILANK